MKTGFIKRQIIRYPITISGPSPSELNKRVSLQYQTRVPDTTGTNVLVTWVTAATVWAKITTLRTTEAILAMQSTGTAIHNILIRYRTDITSAWRIKFGDKYYNIAGPPIDINKAHRWLDIKCKEARQG